MNEPLMTFDQWWSEIYLGGREPSPDQSEAAAFMLSTKEIAARAAWEAGQMVLKEQLSRIIRENERVLAEHAKRQR